MTTGRQIGGLAGWLAVVAAAAAAGALASVNAGTFYQQLTLPPWAPPGWVFAPIWNLLYLLMAVSAWLVWRAEGFSGARTALGLFLVQLAVNALWSWLFFAWRQGAVALAVVILLLVLVVATTAAFRRISRGAAVLLLPYLGWLVFAAALAYSAWRLNPQLL